MMGKVLIINYDICNGCYNCQVACKDEHVANDWSPIAKPQPDTGQFWTMIHDNVRGQVPKVKVTYEHSICQHCDDAPCIPACNAGAIYKREDGAVIIDPTKCRGNKMCIAACPYENIIYFNDSLNIAQKCTFCAHLLDKGWKEPRCVDACPTGAFTFGDETDPNIKALISKAQPLKPDLNVKPRVLYIGLPKKFIAGAVYDPDEDECIEGATVTVSNLDGGEEFTAKTDIYGDFWFEHMKADHTYSLRIEKDEYCPQEIHDIRTAKDVNVGDIELRRKVKSGRR
jgi:Fe-S-cluster-containing dehydrogenase component